MTTKSEIPTHTETIELKGANLVERVKHVLHEGNVRRITITHKGDVVLSIPITVGVVGSLMAPWLAAVGAVAALLSDCTLEVERPGAETEPGESA